MVEAFSLVEKGGCQFGGLGKPVVFLAAGGIIAV
jgi:hypothetical protein